MKTIAAFLLGALFAPVTLAHEAKTAGPNGGRILDKIEPRVEFLVTPERKVKLTFLDAANKAVTAGAQEASVVTGERSKPTTLKFTKQGDVLVSEQVLPEGNNLPTVVTIKQSPDAKAMTAKFNLNLEHCSGCKRAEYACTCAHE